jgi:hypothetical protein
MGGVANSNSGRANSANLGAQLHQPHPNDYKLPDIGKYSFKIIFVQFHPHNNSLKRYLSQSDDNYKNRNIMP